MYLSQLAQAPAADHVTTPLAPPSQELFSATSPSFLCSISMQRRSQHVSWHKLFARARTLRILVRVWVGDMAST